MSYRTLRTFAAAFAAVALLAPGAVNAAFIIIDDSDPNTITISAGDFERGFSVNGNLLTSGLGNSGSLTLPDGVTQLIDGSWQENGVSDGSLVGIFFSPTGGEVPITSGVQTFASTNGSFGTLLNSAFVGYDPLRPEAGPLSYGTVFTYPQDGSTQFAEQPFLSISFTPEAVPEPSTMMMISLLGCALPAAVVLHRRRRSAA